MPEEEKEAIKYFYNIRKTIDESNMLFDEDINIKCGKEMIKQITVILNLIQNQQAELEKARNTKSLYYENEELRKLLTLKDKIINLILEEYVFSDGINTKNYCDEQIRKDCCKQDCINCTKQYFERRVDNNE